MSPYNKITSLISEASQNNRLLNNEETLDALVSLKSISKNKELLKKIVAYLQLMHTQEIAYKTLSKRELQIFMLIGSNFNSKEISENLSISKNTVATHRKNIIKKLGIKGTKQLNRVAHLFLEKELRKNTH